MNTRISSHKSRVWQWLHCLGLNAAIPLLLVPSLIFGQGTDLALGKATTASSQENASYTPAMAVDGNGTTRWASAFGDPQWIRVDLGSAQPVSSVKLVWEAASAKNYTIDLSNDGMAWTTIATKTNMAAGARTDNLTGLSGSGRYIRMNGAARTTVYGYSLFSFTVYGGTVNALTKQAVTASAASSALSASTLAHDGNTTTRWESVQGVDPQWIRFDMGAAKAIVVMVIDWEAANAKNYTVEGSNDVTFGTKTTLVTKTNMPTGQHRIDSLSGLTGSYRYYRMYGTARNLTYGYSIWEARLYSSGGGNQAPVANAGPDQNVRVNAPVTLDGRASYDPDNSPSALSYAWTQTAGPAITLSGATTPQPTFTPASTGTYTFRLTVNDGSAASFDDVVVTASLASNLVFAVNCGGGQYTSPDGTVYAADNSFTGGTVATSTAAIAATNDQPLYQSERWGLCDYVIPGLANGNYAVTFRFAETYWSAVNARVFDVQAENLTLISKLDIYKQVGKNCAYDITSVVSVTDGDLHIKFMNPTADQPKICAFSVAKAFGLQNGNCEAGALTTPMLWTAVPASGAILNWEPLNAGHNGSRCISITHSSANDSRWEQTVYGLVPGATYLVRGYVKGTNIKVVTGTVGANICLTNGSASTKNTVLTGTFDWKPAGFSFVAPQSGTVTLGARLGFSGSTATGRADFDDITMTPTTGRIDASMASVDSIMNSFMADWNVPGGALGIVKDGRLVYARGFGYADREAGQPVQPNSMFRLASVSKSVTSVALMNLIQGGRLGIDAKVFGAAGILNDAAYLPLHDPLDAQITLRQMLQHISGFGGQDPMFFNDYIAQAMAKPMPVDAPTIVSYMMRNVSLAAAPGSTYNYFNFNYCALGRVIEKITGMAYYDYLNSAVLTPLGITDIRLGRNLLANRLSGEVKYYDYDGAGLVSSVYGTGQLVPFPYGGFNLEAMDSHGGLVASAPALLKLLVAVDGFATKPDILNSSTIQLMTTPSVPNPNYACGWAVNTAGNWWHNGDLPGTTTEIVRAGNGLSWVFLFNTRPADIGGFDSAVDNLGWTIVNSVSAWPADDQFGQFK